MKDFTHIHQVLTENGYPESSNSDWIIKIEDFHDSLIIPHYYDCFTKSRAKTAVKSLLNATDIYSVTVHHGKQAVSFHHKFTDLSEHEWNYYFR